MMRSVVALVLALTVCAAAPAAGAQQPDAKQDAGEQIQLGTQEVLLDVVVRDDDKPVTDLRADEVQVFENGERQDLTSFALVQSGSPAPGGGKAPLSLELSPFRGFNYIIVVIDRTSLNQRDLAATYKAAEKFVNERLGPNDLLAVFMAGSRLAMVQNFTNGKERLLAALRLATSGAGSTPDLGRTQRAAERAQIDATEAEGGGSRAEASTPLAGSVQTADQLTSLATGVSGVFAELEDQFQAFAIVQDLLTLMKVYGRIPGRKSVLLYSEGFAVKDSIEGAFGSLIGSANRNNFAIYTVDAGGLRPESAGPSSIASGGLEAPAGIGGADRTQVDALGNSGLGRAEASVRSGGNSALHRLSVETGGVPLRNNNDLNRGFQAVESDLRSYYALSYAPKNPALDGRFRQIEVKVTRKGVDVRARKGYYAVPGVTDGVLLPFEQPVLEMIAGAKPEARPADLPVSLRTERFRAEHGWAVPIVVSLPAASLAPAEAPGAKDDKKDGPPPADFEVDTIAIVRDQKNQVVAKLSRSNPYRSTQADLERFRGLELLATFSQPLVLPPGTYKLSLGVYDPNGRKGTVLERSFRLPELPADAPALSSVVLSREVLPVAAADREKAAGDPFVFEGTTRIVPNATGRFLKSRGDRLVVYFRFYGAPSKEYRVKMEFVKDGKTVSASQPAAMPATDAKGETAFAPSVPVAGLEPGAYLVHVVVLDPETSKPVADSTANFRVD